MESIRFILRNSHTWLEADVEICCFEVSQVGIQNLGVTSQTILPVSPCKGVNYDEDSGCQASSGAGHRSSLQGRVCSSQEGVP